MCQKKYCECFQHGVACTEYCKCEECKNGKPHKHATTSKIPTEKIENSEEKNQKRQYALTSLGKRNKPDPSPGFSYDMLDLRDDYKHTKLGRSQIIGRPVEEIF